MIEEYELELLLNPSNLFENISEVTSFLELSDDLKELQAFKEVCEKEELYEYCKLIQDKINNINDKNSSN